MTMPFFGVAVRFSIPSDLAGVGPSLPCVFLIPKSRFTSIRIAQPSEFSVEDLAFRIIKVANPFRVTTRPSSPQPSGRFSTRPRLISYSLTVVTKVASMAARHKLIHFCYRPEFGFNGLGTTARLDADYHVQLDYDELIQKAGWCRMAPDVMSSLEGIGFPCPNPEGFRTSRQLPPPFIPHD
jgi:hypothetical protein